LREDGAGAIVTRRYRVRVVDAGGAPLERAAVAVVWGTAPTPEFVLLSGPAGEVNLALPDGRYRIAIQTPGGERAELEIDTAHLPEPFTIRIDKTAQLLEEP
jgi:hypothetical protein